MHSCNAIDLFLFSELSKVLCKDCIFRPDLLTNMDAMGWVCNWVGERVLGVRACVWGGVLGVRACVCVGWGIELCVLNVCNHL